MMKTKAAGVWSSLNLGDEKKNQKFAKLMGIKQSQVSVFKINVWGEIKHFYKFDFDCR